MEQQASVVSDGRHPFSLHPHSSHVPFVGMNMLCVQPMQFLRSAVLSSQVMSCSQLCESLS